MTQSHDSAHDLDLNLLRVLDVLLSTQGVTRAARQLGMTQSGVSRALQRLRTHFDDPLLVRDGRRMVLTATAERLRNPVARILDDTRQLFISGRGFDPTQSSWSASLATATFAEHCLLPTLMARIEAEAPGINIHVVGTLGANADDLEQGRVDLAIEPAGVLQGPNLISRRLFSDTFCCLVRRGHPAAKSLTLERYTALEHILIAPNGTPRGPVDEHLARLGLERRVRVQVISFTSPMPLLIHSDRIVTIPRLIAHDLAQRWPVEVVDAPIDVGRFGIHAYWSARRRTDPAHQWLRQQVYDAAAALERRQAMDVV